MAYTKYSLTPSSNTAAPPDGAPEGMLPSAVNDTMRDMMAQIRDCGDGIRDGTYTMTAPKITGGTITGSTINNSAIGGTTASTGKFTTLEATGVATVSAGAVGTPAITTTGDTNTGIFFPTADTIAFAEGGAEAMRIDSSGNVGIGTSSPATKLHVAAETPTLRIDGTVATNSGAILQLLGWTGASKNWQIDTASTSSVNELAFTPSTANAGSTFSTLSQSFRTNGTIGLTVSGSTSGAGITFPATQSASSNANTLDDYEEGTWTPTATSQGGSITSYTANGSYVKIGKSVFVRAEITITNVGTASGRLDGDGLPFIERGERPFVALARENAVTGNTFVSYGAAGATTFQITALTNVGAITWINNYSYVFSATYLTD